jgi:hypothetical protein
MDAKTLAALEGSIKKWEAIVDKRRPNRGGADCPLCHLFNPFFRHRTPGAVILSKKGCEGCPVAERTGQSFCKGSPYERIDAIEYSATPIAHEELESRLHAVAVDELAFLRSLLPGEKPEGLQL